MKKLTSTLLLISILLSSLTLVLPAYAEKTELDVKWNTGYAVISIHNPYGLIEGYSASSNYSATDVFTVPNKGTKITWTDPSGFAPCSVLTLSSWNHEDNSWKIDTEEPLFVGAGGKNNNLIETKNSSGSVTYTYITYKDNENLRLCVNGRDENIKVYAEQTSEKSTWERALSMYYEEPPVPVSPLTGLPINATVLDDIIWNYGYVGSTSHSSSANKISNGSVNYLYSEVITVPKAGTTVYFYDDDCSDGNASSNAAVFSHWKQSGTSWDIDISKPSIDGSQADRVKVGKYILYSYTTTEDNENLRLCYRASLNDYSISVRPYKVYLSAQIEFEPVTATGVLTDAKFKDSTGTELSYKVYMPADYANNPSYKAIFSIGSNTDIADAIIKNKPDTAVFIFNGSKEGALELIENAVPAYGLHKHFIYLIGNSDISAACGDLFAASIADSSGHTSALDAANALLSQGQTYSTKLEGLTMLAMGDSYFAGDGIGKDNTWVNKLGNKYGMNFFNYGIGGSTISEFVTTNNPMVVRLKQMAKVDADIILLEGGRNDYNKLVPFGSTDSTDTKTFNGALNYSLDYLRKTYPDALIVLVTPWYYTGKNSDGNTNVTYANAMKKIAELRNDPHIVCLYAADKTLTGVDMTNEAFREKYCIKPTDVSHLNIDGMNLVFPKIEQFIADAYENFINGNKSETTEEIPVETPPESSSDETLAPEASSDLVTEPVAGGCGSFTVLGTFAAVICGAVLVFRKKD